MNVQTPLTTKLLLCGLLAPVVLLASIAVATLCTPGYDHFSNTISQLAAQGRPRPAILCTGLVLFGLLVTGGSFGLRKSLPSGTSSQVAATAMLAFGTFILLVGVARDYDLSPGAVRNLEGHLHHVFAMLAVIAQVVAMLSVAWSTHRSAAWGAVPRASVIAAIIVLALGGLFVALPAVHQGMLQRGLYTTSLLWMTYTTSVALRNLKSPGIPSGAR